MSSKSFPRTLVIGGLLSAAAGLLATATAGGEHESDRIRAKAADVQVKDGKWSGTAIDDKYGVTGTVSFTIRNDGRLLTNLRMNGMAGDCPGPSGPVLNVRLRRAKIKPSGLMRGHYVEGKPGDEFLAVISYDARFRAGRVSDGRIYQDNDIDNTFTCEVPAATFSATRKQG